MDAVILAGGKITQKNALWSECKGWPKTMIDICGKPMVQWIIDALNQAESIEKIYVIGLSESVELNSEKPLRYLPDLGDIMENLSSAAIRLLKEESSNEYFLSISADIPLINAEIIESVIQNKRPGADVIFSVIEKKTMEAKFPDAKRTLIKFEDGSFCGGDMHLFNKKALVSPVAKKLVRYRKNPVKLISIIGFDILLRMIFSPYTLESGARMIRKRTGIKGYPVVSIWAELGMDIDTPQHLEIVRRYLEKVSQ